MTETQPSIEFTVAGVCERDIDLLLLEEFVASPDFVEWFARAAGLDWPGELRLVRAGRGVTQSMGESDLELVVAAAADFRAVLLVENKIDASFQPDQAARYHQRARDYVDRGAARACRTVLVAPHRYLGGQPADKGFDAWLSYEQIGRWLEDVDLHGRRRRFRRYLLAEAVTKATHGYQPEADAAVTAFWHDYWRLATVEAPGLGVPDPCGRPATSSFVYMHPGDLPPGVRLVHKLAHGRVDLQFAGLGRRLAELHRRYGPLLAEGLSIRRAGESAVIRRPVPPLNPGAPFAPQTAAARTGLHAASELLSWFREVSGLQT